eukprot:CAMPEP_0177425176 /NCGR_PEP_ID=MMETSP0368-20130122/72862_1 /TAXON_ID=447022 ORGANISM="Scrippsiella hangoei-like, Strain SHHI-4" /NCGR_SAMPLE_ID=MMETSP0368 /ASSEMBLY_ACC=CAM_ASM_000363 /LENGTH=90 /DNA_ID=CAMNT_0018895443 /DNA_START=944 /DNA_END=1217 /DNA_ORIENTATION=-
MMAGEVPQVASAAALMMLGDRLRLRASVDSTGAKGTVNDRFAELLCCLRGSANRTRPVHASGTVKGRFAELLRCLSSSNDGTRPVNAVVL